MFLLIAAAVIAVASVATTVYSEVSKKNAAEDLAKQQSDAEKKIVEQTKATATINKLNNAIGTKKLASQVVAATALEKLKTERAVRKEKTLQADIRDAGGTEKPCVKTSAPVKNNYFVGAPVSTN